MLKKLVKYGNSNALVLDKALLELLNITEGSVVKIKTDGTSLIITPQNNENYQGALMPTIIPQEALNAAVQDKLAETYNPADVQAYINESKKVLAHYFNELQKLDSPEFKQRLELLAKKFNGNSMDADYVQAVKALRYECAPALVNFDQEMQDLEKKYIPTSKVHGSQHTFTANFEIFKKIHTKYAHVLQKVAQLQENPDYINESVLLAEKYQAAKNSTEYLEAFRKLICKYIPEYEQYQNELNEVAQKLK